MADQKFTIKGNSGSPLVEITLPDGEALYCSSWSSYSQWRDPKTGRWHEKSESKTYRPPRRIFPPEES